MEWVRRYAVEQLRSARGNLPEIRAALCRYLKQGKGAGFSTGELVDWLGVSSPSLLTQAGYTDDEATRAMDTLGSITDQEIEQIRIGPKPYLP
jgi:hypothetical protein